MMKALLSLLASLALGVGPEAASAKTQLAAGGALVEFPVGTPQRGIGDPNIKHRHGEPWMMLFLGTLDNVEGHSEDDMDLLMAAVKTAELWSVATPDAEEEGEAYWAAAMAFPRRLQARLWAEDCRPPEPGGFRCRPVKVDGAKGREYLLWWKDPTRPGVRPYVAQRIVVRGDRLYLLAHAGSEDASSPQGDTPHSANQEAFLNSLRFDGP